MYNFFRQRQLRRLVVLLLAITVSVGVGCQTKQPKEKQEANGSAATEEQAKTPQQFNTKRLELVSGLGMRLILSAESFEGSSFRVHGVPVGYQVWATITDGSYENYLIFDAASLHVASIRVRYISGKRTPVSPLERHRLHFKKIPEFPVWEAQITANQPPSAGLATEFSDGRFGYTVTTRGVERWLLDGWTFKSTEAIRCASPEMCPMYECVCGHDENGRPRVANGERLACIDSRCVAPESCEEFCSSIDFTEDDTR